MLSSNVITIMSQIQLGMMMVPNVTTTSLLRCSVIAAMWDGVPHDVLGHDIPTMGVVRLPVTRIRGFCIN